MMRMTGLGLVVSVALAAGLAGCGAKDPASQAARDHSGIQPASAPGGLTATAERPERYGSDRYTPRDQADTPKAEDGKPMWAASRQRSAQDAADAAFRRDGEAFGASTREAFVAKVHAFVDHPPKGAETIERANGDVEIYDARSNVFAVATRDGAPRTMFKPDDGAAYWAKEKTKLAERAGKADRGSDRADAKPYASHRRKPRDGDDQG